MVDVVKISEREYCPIGFIEKRVVEVKSVIIDGETYTKQTPSIVQLDLVDYKKEKPKEWMFYEYFYPEFGIDFIFWYPIEFSHIVRWGININYSENNWANCFCYILEKEKIPTIKWFGVIRERDYIRDFKHLSFTINLEHIVSGYHFAVTIPFVEIIKMNWVNNEENIRIQLEGIFFDNKWNGKKFFSNLLPEKIKTIKLNQDEINLILMELYQRKVSLFTRAKRTYKDRYDKNQYILKNLNKSCYQ